jgi:hypothetical protein
VGNGKTPTKYRNKKPPTFAHPSNTVDMADSEIDGILLITMRHAGCEIPDNMTVALMEPDVLVKITSHCLALAGNDFPRYAKAQLPSASQQSSRFRVCNVLSEAVKKLVSLNLRWIFAYLVYFVGLQE